MLFQSPFHAAPAGPGPYNPDEYHPLNIVDTSGGTSSTNILHQQSGMTTSGLSTASQGQASASGSVASDGGGKSKKGKRSRSERKQII